MISRTFYLATAVIFAMPVAVARADAPAPFKLDPLANSADYNERALAEDPDYVAYGYPRQTELEIDPTLLGKCLALTARSGASSFRFSKTEMDFPYKSGEFEAYL